VVAADVLRDVILPLRHVKHLAAEPARKVTLAGDVEIQHARGTAARASHRYVRGNRKLPRFHPRIRSVKLIEERGGSLGRAQRG